MVGRERGRERERVRERVREASYQIALSHLNWTTLEILIGKIIIAFSSVECQERTDTAESAYLPVVTPC